MELDANSKLGAKIIPGDPKEQSKNGELLEKVITENDLIVVNATDICSGVITRFRKTINGVALLDKVGRSDDLRRNSVTTKLVVTPA